MLYHINEEKRLDKSSAKGGERGRGGGQGRYNTKASAAACTSSARLLNSDNSGCLLASGGHPSVLCFESLGFLQPQCIR